MEERLDLPTCLELCRPGSDDLELPELADAAAAVKSDPVIARQFEALQRWDHRLRDAIGQGDVPEYLEERILSALPPADAAAVASPAVAAPQRHPTRRRVWTALALAASLTAVGTGLVFWSVLKNDDELTVTTIHEHAADWCDALVETRWISAPPPADFPFDAREVLLSHDDWQKTSLPDAAGDAVAYRIPPPTPSVHRMTLLVFKGPVSGLGPFAPREPYVTQGRLVGAWQVGENVYVLVIQGDDLGGLQDVYQRSVNTHRRAA